MTQSEKAKQFAGMHVKGSPVVLYNAWDAGSAKAILNAGAKAIATSSWAVAAAQGFKDGEDMPLEDLAPIVARITATIEAPVTVDFEGGYSDDEQELQANVARILDLGVIGINFEDRVVKGSGLYAVDKQARRVAAIREAANRKGVDLFINARTDLFLGRGGAHADEIGAALERAKAYAAAGASGFFVPGLTDDALIARMCDGTDLPVNVMMMAGVSPIARLSSLGVSRVSFGAAPYVRATAELLAVAKDVYSPVAA